MKTTGLSSNLFRLIPNTAYSYQTRTMDKFTKYQCRTEAFQSSFFPWTITEWKSLDPQARNLSYTAFQKHFVHEFRPIPNCVFNIHNPIRIKLGLSHLNQHKFKHKFHSCTNSKCICSFENESTAHFFLDCHFYIPIQAPSFDKLKEIVNNLQEFSDQYITEILLYGSPNLNFKDTHRENAPPNKTTALKKSRNNCIWIVCTSNQLFIRDS